jgi:hypothetical protein
MWTNIAEAKRLYFKFNTKQTIPLGKGKYLVFTRSSDEAIKTAAAKKG